MLPDWQRIADSAASEAASFEAALEQPRASQLALLKRIMAANAACPFGIAHDFAAIDSLADFQARVPLTSHDGYAADIAQMANGEARLTSERLVAFERTGGSSSGSKLIPYTPAALDAFRRAILPWMDGVLQRHPRISEGRFYPTISPATRQPETTAAGTPIGLQSDAAYLGEDLIAPFLGLLAVPPSLGTISDPSEWQIATLAALIEATDLTFVSLWSPTFLLVLIEALPSHGDAVMARLTAPARARLDEAMRAGDMACLWPRLACISCWTDGASAGFARILAQRFPHVAIDPKGVLATEAPITLSWGPDARRVPALTSCVIEFIDTDGTATLCDELGVGGTYRAVLTTPGGLYRYDIGDLFECRGMVGSVPDLAFLGRGGLTSDLVGEKLDDCFVSGLLAGLDLAALIVPRADGKGYEMLLDGTGHGSDPVGAVEAGLCTNSQYGYARRIGQLEPLQLRATGELSAVLVAHALAAGRRIGDVKASGLLSAPIEDSHRP